MAQLDASSTSGRRSNTSALTYEAQARELANRLPDLMIEAKRIAATVAHGIHGRRRAGPGETFWQFRQYEPNDSTTLIDWRRSASSNHVFVREREWEAAHTIWLWPDLSASMQFCSDLSSQTKRDRAIVLSLATSELLVRGGERVALLGLTNPTASRNATARLAQTLLSHLRATKTEHPSLPPDGQIPRYSNALLFSDFLDPLDIISERIQTIASSGVSGHLIQVLDPAEETLPYSGRVEFIASEGDDRWIADRAESLRKEYREKLEAHRAGLNAIAHKLGWSLLIHHTDRPPSEPLLSLIMQLQNRNTGSQWRNSKQPDQASQAGGTAAAHLTGGAT